MFTILFSIIGCTDTPHTDSKQHHIIFQKALDAYNAGKYAESLKLFEQASLLTADNPEIYLYAALICDSAVMDHDKAQKYYGQFLKLSPDTEKKEMVKKWMAILSATHVTPDTDVSSKTIDQLQKKIKSLSSETEQLNRKINKKNDDYNELQKRLEHAETTIETLNNDLRTKESIISQLNQEIESAQLRQSELSVNNIHTPSSSSSFKSNSFLEPPEMNSQVTSDAFHKYYVAEGDTLPDIAEKFYGSSIYWRTLWEANRFQLQDTAIKPGQILIIPPKPVETSKISG
ncbi:LysM peptidoglycan-binding domain-containing protein [bacterium]|nr:LysM peptidoglycan-binding domain-containing protein [bacterium]MCP5462547.1 LysM peptidoglycan-binding domain-containing protein [bacterium]